MEAITKHCPFCRRRFTTKSKKKIYCRAQCQQDAANSRVPKPLTLNLPSGTVGALSEMIAASDLMSKGFGVFRALSPACHCDLIATTENMSYRIEVTTGHMVGDKLRWPPKQDVGHDVLAVVIAAEHRVVYFSKLAELERIFKIEPLYNQ